MLAVVAIGALVPVGCNSGPGLANRSSRLNVPPRDVDPALRGTIGSMASVRGVEPLLVSGYGFVVGLNGTGGQVLNEQISQTLERMMALRGVGQPGAYEGTPLEEVTPRQLIQDRNTAAVIVYGAVPPGARKGDRFDVFVRALNASSLEGGRLWTTEMNIGQPTTTVEAQTRRAARASGEMFINPFGSDEGSVAGVSANVGRVLDGGVTTEDLLIRVELDNPSHARAQVVTSAINTRFPRRSGERESVAHGVNDTLIEVRVPREYVDRPDRFVQMLIRLQLDTSSPQIYATRYIRAMQQDVTLANDMAFALEALGEPAIPFVRELYESPEYAVRLAALQAGAGLGDPRAAPRLAALSDDATGAARFAALRELGQIDSIGRVDDALRSKLASESLTVRVAAYEALASRAERAQARYLAAAAPSGMRSPSGLRRLAQLRIPPDTTFGLARESMDGKFLLDRLAGGDPLIYVTQQGLPRIAVFGDEVKLNKPVLAEALGGRMLITAESESDTLRMFYRPVDPDPYDDRTPAAQIREIGDNVTWLIDLMARDPSASDDEPGLGLGYSEVIGVLYDLNQAGAINAEFSTERDKLLAELLNARQQNAVTLRPITSGEEREVVVLESGAGAPVGAGPQPAGGVGSLLEPVPPRPDGN
ncbi:MAG: flagellar basal body P-ring protein FlgI [Planctomycetota bacterium]